MKFNFIDRSDLTGKTELELLVDVRELLRVLVNETRAVRALVHGLSDPEDMHQGEGGKG